MSIKSEKFPDDFEEMFKRLDSTDRYKKDVAFSIWCELKKFEAENKALKDILDSCYKMMACYWNATNDGHPLYRTTQGIIQKYHALKEETK